MSGQNKKRGFSGASNAANIAFRYGGWNAHNPSGSPHVGKPVPGSAFDKPAKGMSYAEATEADKVTQPAEFRPKYTRKERHEMRLMRAAERRKERSNA